MAFIQRLIQNTKFSRQNSRKLSTDEIKTDWKKPQFNNNAIRIVLFTDSDVKGRKLIFDSKAVVREETKGCRSKWGRGQKLTSLKEGSVQSPGSTNQKGLPRYEYQKTGSDIKMLEEMMFGAEGMAYKGTSLKVHVIRSPPQLMLTKVFIPERPKRASTLELDDSLKQKEEPFSYWSAPDLSAPRNISDSGKHSPGIAHSVPMDVPSPKQSWMKSIDLIDEDSGLASLQSDDSFQTPFPSPGSSTTGSCSSLNSERRWRRIQSTSLESFSRRQSQHDIIAHVISSPARQKRSKLALGIMFGTIDENNDEANRLFENFFFSHIALFEGRLERLRLSVEQAYYSGRTHLFLDIMIHAFESFKMDIQDLYTAPRLSEPVWLNMMSFSSYRYVLCDKFLHEFMGLVTRHDNKNTNFFMSTLVTAVLTYHLAWVPTVMPAGGVPSNTYLDKHSAKWVDTLAKSHPYNPLWAQLGDLYGSIGFPLKLSRTVVVGKKAELVKRLLYVLSYFIRCSDVLEATDWGSLERYMKKLDFTESPNDTEKTPTAANSCMSLSNVPVSQSPKNTSDGFTSLNPDSIIGQSSNSTSGSNKFVPLNLDSVENDCNSNSAGNVWVKQDPCAACNANRASDSYENKIGKSVFYVHSKTCSCDNLTDSRFSTEPNPIEQSNLEKGKSLENLRSKKRSFSLKLDIPGHSKSRCENHSTIKTVTPDSSLKECRLSVAQIVEDTKVHNVQHVRKSSDFDIRQIKSLKNDNGLNLDNLKHVAFTGSDSKLTAQQYKDCVGKIMSKEEIKAVFLKKGSNSLFNEYFEENIETKTIDDLDEKDLVNELRSVGKQRFKSGDHSKQQEDLENSIKAPSMPDLTRMKSDSSQVKSESEIAHRVRLGSLDQSFRSRKKSFNRQISESGARAIKGAPGRCRPVTPTELSRRRHMSSTSTIDFDTLDPRAYCRELPMPETEDCDDRCSQKCFDKNFGRSLLADYSDHYMSDFVLHGTSDRLYQEKMMKDVRMATQYSVLDEPIAEAVCVVADTDQWTVNVCSSQHLDKTVNGQQQCVSSQLVSSMIESVLSMWKLKMSPEFCMMHLEDRLQEIYFKSKMMAEYLKGTKHRNIKELIAMQGFDRSDLPLLVAIAGTHTPHFPLVVLS